MRVDAGKSGRGKGPPSAVVRIIGFYVLMSSLWIYLSDTIIGRLINSPELITRIGIYKGFLFILVTSCVLFKLISRYLKDMTAAEETLRIKDFAIEQISDAVYWCTMDGRFWDVNEAACNMLGYSRDELLGMTVFDIDSHASVEELQSLNEVLRSTGRVQLNRFHISRDGRKIPVDLTINYFLYRDSEYACAIVRDRTEQHKAEKEASFFKTLVEYTRDPVYVLDSADDWRLVYVNQATCAHFGMEREKLLTMRIPDWDPYFDMDILEPAFRQMKKQGTSARFETLHRVASGEIVPVEITANYLEHDGKELSAGYFKNISDRKRAEEELRESEERYRGLVELFPDAIYIHTGGKLVFVNSQGAKLLGAESPEELIGREALDFVHPDYVDFVRQRISNAFELGTPNPPVEELFLRLDGTSVPVEVSSCPFTYRGEKALQIIARDISTRRSMQDELLKAQKLESLGVLAGGIAHDFNNFLTGILGNLSFAGTQIDASHPVAARLRECEKAAWRASELTRQLLTFSRGGEPVKKLFTPAPLIRDAASFTLRGKNVKSVIEIADDLWCIEADEGQLNQVMHNLLLNAVQAMPSGGEVAVRAANEMLSWGNPCHLPPGNYVRIEVLDTGCGIPCENLVRVFDPYFTTKAEGSGLGLASVYSIVRKHSGAVEISSAIGEGSCLVVHLPALPDKSTECSFSRESEFPAGTGRILVMDDEEIILDVATEILRYAGYETESCSDGREAVELYRKAKENSAPFSAVILDITVPNGMGGREAASLILEMDSKAVLIVSSGYSNDPVLANFRDYGFRGAIPKPFDADKLVRELAAITDG